MRYERQAVEVQLVSELDATTWKHKRVYTGTRAVGIHYPLRQIRDDDQIAYGGIRGAIERELETYLDQGWEVDEDITADQFTLDRAVVSIEWISSVPDMGTIEYVPGFRVREPTVGFLAISATILLRRQIA